MKKITLFATLILTTLITSCGSDDEDNKHPIVGTWQLEEVYTNGVSDSIPDCEKETIVIYGEDESYEATYKNEFDESGMCNEEVYNGTWINVVDNEYHHTIDTDSLVVFNVAFPSGRLNRERTDSGGDVIQQLFKKVN